MTPATSAKGGAHGTEVDAAEFCIFLSDPVSSEISDLRNF